MTIDEAIEHLEEMDWFRDKDEVIEVLRKSKESLQNLLGFFDTPVNRLKHSEMQSEACQIARKFMECGTED